MTFQKSDINRRGGGTNSKNNNIPIISEVDEENEETIMEKAKINSGRGSTTTNSLSKPKSAADNWKGIGNRHMASQEYEEAYKAYSTALSISPLGPASHIYLSNRAAALLSLKKYSAASVDARRAITLAPTFGKAHARLGQSLYFLKDYAGAVAAYQNAFQFEPDNQVTWTYLNKAKKKFARENERRRRMKEGGGGGGGNRDFLEQVGSMGGSSSRSGSAEKNNYYQYHEVDEKGDDGVSVSETVDLANMAISVVGDTYNAKDRNVAVLSTHDEGDDIDQLVAAVDRGESSIVRGKIQAALDSSHVQSMSQSNEDLDDSFNNQGYDELGDIDDPDFDEALRLHEVATMKLVNKEYKSAVEEFSAALFLVPDDTNLTPQLYIGRAHALNGLHRHEGALNDSMMALGRNPHLPEAHVVLARTYFYVKNFNGAIRSFDKAREILKERDDGNNLSPLDELYYEKALSMPRDEIMNMDEEASFQSRAMRAGKPVPKLKPPRFVSRQELLNSPEKLNVPPMPKAFSNQVSSLPATLRVGKERKVVILTDSMGVTLNRGQDGIIRVLAVAPDGHGAKHTRRGQINPGDIVREAAGVDLRRPLTQVMWSDTVAFLKFSPRPLHIVVAKELSEKPISVQEEIARVSPRGSRPDPPRGFDPPSRATGSESVSETASELDGLEVGFSRHRFSSSSFDNTDDKSEKDFQAESSIEAKTKRRGLSDELDDLDFGGDDNRVYEGNEDYNDKLGELNVEDSDNTFDEDNEGFIQGDIKKDNNTFKEPQPDVKNEPQSTTMISELQRDQSQQLPVLSSHLEKDFIFLPSNEDTLGYTNTRWLSESSTRHIEACGDVFIFQKSNNFFWQKEHFVPRTLVVYTDLLVIGREASNAAEIRSCQNDPKNADMFDGIQDAELMESFLIAEIVVDFKTSKIRRCSLTTPSSVECFNEDFGLSKDEDIELRKICFEIVTPTKSYILSAMNANEGAEKFIRDNAAMFLTTQWEESIKEALCNVHQSLYPGMEDDKSWIHQIILGTLHSHVLTGNYRLLEKALEGKGTPEAPYCGIDDVDDDGLTVLHHACCRRSNIAVFTLLKAGADCTKTTLKGRNTPCHLSAKQLDANSLFLILSQTQPHRPDPNALNESGLTPMIVAIMDGRAPGGKRDPTSLRQCVSSLQAWDAKLHVPYCPHPIHTLSAEWCHEELEIIFPLCDCSFPVTGNGLDGYSESLGALYDYPLHACVVQLRDKIAQMKGPSKAMFSLKVDDVVRTVEVLLDRGFEPNERIEHLKKNTEPLNELIGFTPLQIIGAAAMDLKQKSIDLECNYEDEEFNQAISLLSGSAEILIKKGAILSLDPPPIERFNAKTSSQESTSSDTDLELRNVDRSLLNLDRNKDIMKILNKNQTIINCQSERQKIKFVNGYGYVNYLQGKGLSIKIDDCYVAGGSNEKSCAICWKKFGSIRNRRHICRSSRRYVCENCSSKSVFLNGDTKRVSDGQFNFAKVIADKEDEKDRIAKARAAEKEEQERIEMEETRKEMRDKIDELKAEKRNALQETQKDEAAAKDTLFGNIGRNVQSFFMEEEEVPAAQQETDTSNKLSGMMSSLGQTRQAFDERGEKLNNMVEKTRDLQNASENFAKMARELKESQQNRGLFW